MKTFDQFLFEADARRLQVGKAAEAGGKLAGGVSGLAGAAGSLASGNFFGGIWGVLKSTLAAFEGITDTANAVSKLSEIQKLHSRLYAHISGRHGKSVADQYVEAVFEADDDIIPLIPPASWDFILSTFVDALNGKMEDYQNLTFTHAIATVLEQNLQRVKSVVEAKQSKWDRKLQTLDHRYHALEDYFEKTAPNSSVVKNSKTPAPDDYSGFGQHGDAGGEIDYFGDSPSAKKPPVKKTKKSWWGGYQDMDELKADTLAKLRDSDLPMGWHGSDEENQDQAIAAMIKDQTKFKQLIDYVSNNVLDRRLTPTNIIYAAKKLVAQEKAEAQKKKDQEYRSIFGDDGPPA